MYLNVAYNSKIVACEVYSSKIIMQEHLLVQKLA